MEGTLEQNLKALMRCDPSGEKILDKVSQVALYKFVPERHQWSKTDVEGCLFVYQRSVAPKFSFLIMNRQKPCDFVEPINNLEFNASTPPYLFYKRLDGSIYGLWFYNMEDCSRMFKQLTRLSQTKSTKDMESPGKSDSNKDILKLLSRAHSEYDKSPGKKSPEYRGPPSVAELEGPPLVKPLPLRPPPSTSTPQHKKSVALDELFASAGTESPGNNSCESMPKMLQRILSFPNDSAVVELEEDTQKTRRSVGQRLEGAASNAGTPPTEKEIGELRFTTPTPGLLTPAAILDSSIHRPLSGGLLAPQDLSLLATAGTNSRHLDSAMLDSSDMFSNGNFSWYLGEDASPGSTSGICPLTKEQVAQALMYMLKKDPTFVDRLHKAYVDSLTENLKNRNIGDSQNARI